MSSWTDTTPTQRPSGRHPVNVGHLVMGLALLGLVGIWALIESEVVTGGEIRWLLPIPWVVAGAVGLIAIAVGGTRRYPVNQTGWVEPTEPTDSTTETTADISEETR